MPFTTELKTRVLDDGRSAELLDVLRYETKTSLFVVPRGFVTNYATVPRLLWSIFPPMGRYSNAAVIHDWLYKEKIGSRFMADCVFRDAMWELKVSWWKRVLMFYAVRVFGCLVY
jgi:hypothetical protein